MIVSQKILIKSNDYTTTGSLFVFDKQIDVLATMEKGAVLHNALRHCSSLRLLIYSCNRIEESKRRHAGRDVPGNSLDTKHEFI